MNFKQLLRVLSPPSLPVENFRSAVRALDVSKASATRVKDRAALTAELINGGSGLPEVSECASGCGYQMAVVMRAQRIHTRCEETAAWIHVCRPVVADA